MDRMTYSEFVDEAVAHIDRWVKSHKEGDVREAVESFGLDYGPCLREMTYLFVFALFLSIRHRFRAEWETIIKDIEIALFEMVDIGRFSEADVLGAKMEFNQRIIEHMTSWNQGCEAVQDKVEPFVEPARLLVQAAREKAYGAAGDDARLHVLMTGLFASQMRVLHAALASTEIEGIF